MRGVVGVRVGAARREEDSHQEKKAPGGAAGRGSVVAFCVATPLPLADMVHALPKPGHARGRGSSVLPLGARGKVWEKQRGRRRATRGLAIRPSPVARAFPPSLSLLSPVIARPAQGQPLREAKGGDRGDATGGTGHGAEWGVKGVGWVSGAVSAGEDGTGRDG